MWRGDEASPAALGRAACGPNPGWRIIGPDRRAAQALAQMLARFDVPAEPADAAALPSAVTPVLCDARSQALVDALLESFPARPAPLLVFGVNAPHKRAQLILAGADDTVSARITPHELAARMIAARRARAAAQGIIHLAGFTFDTGLRKLCWQGEIVSLMPREFDLLLVLARHGGLVVSRSALLRTVWRTAFDPGTNSPEVHIFKLRQKLAVLGGAVRIETVKRQGYRLVTDPEARG